MNQFFFLIFFFKNLKIRGLKEINRRCPLWLGGPLSLLTAWPDLTWPDLTFWGTLQICNMCVSRLCQTCLKICHFVKGNSHGRLWGGGVKSDTLKSGTFPKSGPSAAAAVQYVTLQTCFSHPSFSFFFLFLATPPWG
jgi:hypothetical protein